MKPFIFCLAAWVLGAGPLAAATVSINFTDNGSADSTMAPGDIAGVTGAATRVANWNNANVAGATGSASGLVFADGSSSGVSLSWTTNLGQWRLGHAVENGDDRMWKGYLDAAGSAADGSPAAAISIIGVPFVGTYDVYVYFDGENGTAWRMANYAIRGQGISALGEDSESTSWGAGQNAAKVYQLPAAGTGGNATWPISPNNNEGNYIVLSGVSGSSFILDAWGSTNTGNLRAPINGIQIVGVVPEPASAVLAGLGGLCLLARRRK